MLKPKPIQSKRKFFIDIALVVISGIVLSGLIKAFLFQGFYIPSGSMEPTLKINDRIIVNQLYPSPLELKTGDIIVFQDTEGWMGTPSNAEVSFIELMNPLHTIKSNNYIIKRVIGVSGDTISYRVGDNFITINGKKYVEEYLPQGLENSSIDFEIKVPEGYVWVMGDNRNNSSDSRYNTDKNNGLIPESSIIGKAIILYYPLPNFTTL